MTIQFALPTGHKGRPGSAIQPNQGFLQRQGTTTSAQRKTVRTRVCVVSDTHNSTRNIPPCDILIHCGDLTLEGRETELQGQFAMLAAAPAPLKLVIAGNHDISLDRKYYARRGREIHGRDCLDAEGLDRIRNLWCGVGAREAGIVFLEREGVSGHALENGARFRVYASAWQPEYCDWAFGYPRKQDRFNVRKEGDSLMAAGRGNVNESLTDNEKAESAENPVPDFPGVDIVVTHGPPRGILDKTDDDVPVGCRHLAWAMERARPLLHCFGHIHEGRGAAEKDWETGSVRQIEPEKQGQYSYIDATGREWGKDTVCVNASIMDVHYRPVHEPWLVDIDLPVS